MSLFRPVGYVIGLLVLALGGAMLIPVLVDFWSGPPGAATGGLTAAALTATVGALLAMASHRSDGLRLTLQQTFLLTTGTWVVLPIFGALPLWLVIDGASYTDAFFEAMSGLTTTGATTFSGLAALSPGVLLWRAMLQWFGGIGIIVVAMAFLPSLKVGGMQIFRSEGFDTFGKILPRAAEIAGSIAWIYLAITGACFLAYSWAGMAVFDALCHALTTISTGGFSTEDASMGAFKGAPEYVASVFMVLASLPFIRFVQLLAGAPFIVLFDAQVRGFLATAGLVVLALVLWLFLVMGVAAERALREALFNAVSILSGTGYASADYQLWGSFAVAGFFLIGLIGGCAGSTCCSIKVFRFQLLFAAVQTQVRRLHSPHGVFTPRYDGRAVTDDVINSVMAFFVMFMLSLSAVAIVLALMGLDAVTAISGAAAALANIGPGLGPIIGPAGTYGPLPDAAKWVLAAAMLLGRLELLSVFVLFSAAFWRR